MSIGVVLHHSSEHHMHTDTQMFAHPEFITLMKLRRWND